MKKQNTLLLDVARLNEESNYSKKFLKPTSYAFKTIKKLLKKVDPVISPMPLGYAYPDGDGGIRISWAKSERKLRLIISSEKSGKSYIYHADNNNFAVDYDVSPQKLVYWLNWFGGRFSSKKKGKRKIL